MTGLDALRKDSESVAIDYDASLKNSHPQTLQFFIVLHQNRIYVESQSYTGQGMTIKVKGGFSPLFFLFSVPHIDSYHISYSSGWTKRF